MQIITTVSVVIIAISFFILCAYLIVPPNWQNNLTAFHLKVSKIAFTIFCACIVIAGLLSELESVFDLSPGAIVKSPLQAIDVLAEITEGIAAILGWGLFCTIIGFLIFMFLILSILFIFRIDESQINDFLERRKPGSGN